VALLGIEINGVGGIRRGPEGVSLQMVHEGQEISSWERSYRGGEGWAAAMDGYCLKDCVPQVGDLEG